MLDAFLETVCDRTKEAEAEARNLELLRKLPAEVLYKIADGSIPLGKEANDSCWLEKFQGTPLLDQAIAIERAELEFQMEDVARSRARAQLERDYPWDATQAKRDELAIKRKLLDLELAGAPVEDEMGGQEGEDLEADPAAEAHEEAASLPAPSPEAAKEEQTEAAEVPVESAPQQVSAEEPKPKEKKPPVTKVTKETTEKPQEEKIDIKAAAAKMRFSLMAKQGFAITNKGHEFDAKLYDMKARHAAERMALGEEFGAHRFGGPGAPPEAGGALQRALNIVRFGSNELAEGDPRHLEYAAKQHAQGSNAWNPLGGSFTPSSHEEGGTGLMYGRYKKPGAPDAVKEAQPANRARAFRERV